MRQKLLLLGAVFFGLVAFYLTYSQIQLEKQKILGAAKTVTLLQVNDDMISGSTISEQDITIIKQKRFKNITTREIPAEKLEFIIGRKLAFPVSSGHILEWNDLKRSSYHGNEGLSGIIPKGFRAISIAVDSTSSVTQLINPNNHVDIIGTFRFPEMKGDQDYDTLTLTILQNVMVLATGKEVVGLPSSNLTSRSKGYSTITLALTPKEVEMILFAAQKGRLQLSLRNFDETKIEKNLQSVNFKFLEDNVQKYTQEREKFMMRAR